MELDYSKQLTLNDLLDKGIDYDNALEAVQKYSDTLYIYKLFNLGNSVEYEVKQEGSEIIDDIIPVIGTKNIEKNEEGPKVVETEKIEEKKEIIEKNLNLFEEKPQDIFFMFEKPKNFYDYSYQGPVNLENFPKSQASLLEFDFNDPSTIPKINLQYFNGQSNNSIQSLTEYASKLSISEKKLNLENSILIDYLIYTYLGT